MMWHDTTWIGLAVSGFEHRKRPKNVGDFKEPEGKEMDLSRVSKMK